MPSSNLTMPTSSDGKQNEPLQLQALSLLQELVTWDNNPGNEPDLDYSGLNEITRKAIAFSATVNDNRPEIHAGDMSPNAVDIVLQLAHWESADKRQGLDGDTNWTGLEAIIAAARLLKQQSRPASSAQH